MSSGDIYIYDLKKHFPQDQINLRYLKQAHVMGGIYKKLQNG